jgi:hypothetical protein
MFLYLMARCVSITSRAFLIIKSAIIGIINESDALDWRRAASPKSLSFLLIKTFSCSRSGESHWQFPFFNYTHDDVD